MRKKIDIDKLLRELDQAYNYAQTAILTWKDTEPIYQTREQWLNALMDCLRTHFQENDYHLNGNIRLSCGFPRGRKVIVGQCWSYTQSKDKTTEIFISPTIDDPIEAGSVLTHELVHASVGLKAGHMKPFKQCAIAIGLTGKMTQTTASPRLIMLLADYFDQIGRYPHATLKDLDAKKQTTRLIKVTCPECHYTARIARKWLDDSGAPICPTCNISLKES